jgi:large subunit ribosomal protein L24
MKIKKDDNVIVLTGKDKGKTGKVVRAFPRELKVIVDGVNIKKRHERSRKQDGKGKIVEMPHPIHVSNVKKQ